METFNIIAIDPGNNIGVGIITVDSYTLNIVSIESRIYVLDNYIVGLSEHNKMIHKLNAIHNITLELLHNYNPLAFGVETAFLNTRFPKAVLQLSQYTGIIEQTVHAYNPMIKHFRYMPRYIKKMIGATGNADKNDMLVCVSKIPDIIQHINVNYLTEHEIDAISIAYVMLDEIKQNPYILYAL